jgi:CubicO group peptidase (beta-lactamase class C family)
MNTFRQMRLIVALVRAAAIASTASGAQDSRFAPVERLIDEQMRTFFLPSIVVVVARNGEIVWERAFGWADVARRRRATLETPYYMASVTKSLTATALMTLVERGRVHLDAPVNEYTGGAQIHSGIWDPSEATVRRVASHTAGLPNFWRDCADDRTGCGYPSLDRAIQRYGFLVRAPGTQPFGYSGLGYEVLAAVIARRSGTTYATYLRDAVFRPLGLRSCAMGDEPPRSAARPYNAGTKQPRGAIVSSTPAAGASWCSARDLARFGTALMGAPMNRQRQILTPASVETMFAPQVAAQGMEYALGWWRRDLFGYSAVYVQGGTFDAHVSLYLVPSERIAVALVANSSHGTLFQTVSEAAIAALLPLFRQRYEAQKATAAATPAPPSAPAPTTLATPGTGIWRGVVRTPDGNLPLILNVGVDGSLTASLSGEPPMPLTQPRSGSLFVRGFLKGAIPNDDVPSAPPDMELLLALRDGKLVGPLTMQGVIRGAGFFLPHLVELTRDNTNP